MKNLHKDLFLPISILLSVLITVGTFLFLNISEKNAKISCYKKGREAVSTMFNGECKRFATDRCMHEYKITYDVCITSKGLK